MTALNLDTNEIETLIIQQVSLSDPNIRLLGDPAAYLVSQDLAFSAMSPDGVISRYRTISTDSSTGG